MDTRNVLIRHCGCLDNFKYLPCAHIIMHALLQLVLIRVAAIKHRPVHFHSADYIFSGPFGSLGLF